MGRIKEPVDPEETNLSPIELPPPRRGRRWRRRPWRRRRRRRQWRATGPRQPRRRIIRPRLPCPLACNSNRRSSSTSSRSSSTTKRFKMATSINNNRSNINTQRSMDTMDITIREIITEETINLLFNPIIRLRRREGT